MTPPVLPFHFLRREQPEPVQTLVARLTVEGQPVTSLARVWLPGDTRWCRLCARCRADHRNNFCLLLVSQAVAPGEAPLFDCNHMKVIRNGDRPRSEPIRPGA